MLVQYILYILHEAKIEIYNFYKYGSRRIKADWLLSVQLPSWNLNK
jgi:hypothetical protein